MNLCRALDWGPCSILCIRFISSRFARNVYNSSHELLLIFSLVSVLVSSSGHGKNVNMLFASNSKKWQPSRAEPGILPSGPSLGLPFRVQADFRPPGPKYCRCLNHCS